MACAANVPRPPSRGAFARHWPPAHGTGPLEKAAVSSSNQERLDEEPRRRIQNECRRNYDSIASSANHSHVTCAGPLSPPQGCAPSAASWAAQRPCSFAGYHWPNVSMARPQRSRAARFSGGLRPSPSSYWRQPPNPCTPGLARTPGWHPPPHGVAARAPRPPWAPPTTWSAPQWRSLRRRCPRPRWRAGRARQRRFLGRAADPTPSARTSRSRPHAWLPDFYRVR